MLSRQRKRALADDFLKTIHIICLKRTNVKEPRDLDPEGL